MNTIKNKLSTIRHKLVSSQTNDRNKASAERLPMHSISSEENPSEFSYSSLSILTSSGYSTSSTGVKNSLCKTNDQSSVYAVKAMLPMGNINCYLYNETKVTVVNRDKANERLIAETIDQFLQHQTEYIDSLGVYIEHFIRPLSFLLDTNTFLSIFQNIEKIYRISECLKRSVQNAHQSTGDLKLAFFDVIYENFQIILSTYEFYLNGYRQATGLANKWAPLLHKKVSGLQQLQQPKCVFDLKKILELPVLHLAKIYVTFKYLSESTPLKDSARINYVFNQLKDKISTIEIQDFVDSKIRKQEISMLSQKSQIAAIRRRLVEKSRHLATDFCQDRWNEFDGIKLYYV